MSVLSRPRSWNSSDHSVRTRTSRLRLPYNALFLPEYVSTVLLSLLISWFFITNVNGPLGGWHVMFAAISYGVLAIYLLWMTWYHRVVYSDIIFRREPEGRVQIRAARQWIDVEQLDSLEETFGTFFGRETRILHARNSHSGSFQVNQCLSGFEQLKSILHDLSGVEVTSFEQRSAEHLEKLAARWKKRHEIFPPAFTAVDAAGRLGFRAFCLLPVAVVDVSINAILNVLLQDAGRGALTVYVAPLSLLVSAFIARYMYYYMFTSTHLNQRIG